MDNQDPTAKWASFKSLPRPLKKRISLCFKRINIKPALEEAKRIFERDFKPGAECFSAGRNWLCTKLVSEPKKDEEDLLAIILRVRMPPETHIVLDENFKNHENARFFHEQHNAEILAEYLTTIRIPRIYHVYPWDSSLADQVGYPFMLMECIGGNKLKDVLRSKGMTDYSELDETVKDHIMSQWADLVVNMSTLRSNYIGPIVAFDSVSGSRGTWGDDPPMMYRFSDCGLFSRASHYFGFHLRQRTLKLIQELIDCHGADQAFVTAEFLGVLLFGDILLQQITWREGEEQAIEFPLVHKTLAESNILMDDEFNFVALVDLKDAVSLPEELQDSYKWDCWRSQESKEKYHSMLVEAEKNKERKGYKIRLPLSKVSDNKIKTAFKLYNQLGENTLEDPLLVMQLLDLVELSGWKPIYYLAQCVTRHWSCWFGIYPGWAMHPETGRVAWEAVQRAMNPQESFCNEGGRRECDI